MATNVGVIEVLGPGCARCHQTLRVVQNVVDEAHLLSRVLKRPLIAVFIGIVTVAIIVTGYLFNAVL